MGGQVITTYNVADYNAALAAWKNDIATQISTYMNSVSGSGVFTFEMFFKFQALLSWGLIVPMPWQIGYPQTNVNRDAFVANVNTFYQAKIDKNLSHAHPVPYQDIAGTNFAESPVLNLLHHLSAFDHFVDYGIIAGEIAVVVVCGAAVVAAMTAPAAGAAGVAETGGVIDGAGVVVGGGSVPTAVVSETLPELATAGANIAPGVIVNTATITSAETAAVSVSASTTLTTATAQALINGANSAGMWLLNAGGKLAASKIASAVLTPGQVKVASVPTPAMIEAANASTATAPAVSASITLESLLKNPLTYAVAGLFLKLML